ncbi:MAG: hypothetical protein K5695_11085 [Oscillospiraceae bacterium]|nr:hypothetical protein [Oscillospiraceae bacterium]
MQAKTKYKHYYNGIISYEDILVNAKAMKLSPSTGGMSRAFCTTSRMRRTARTSVHFLKC